MNELKTIYCTSTCRIGEADLFFDEDYNLLSWWACNDAMYRHEYMSELFEKLGYKVVDIDENIKEIKEAIEKVGEEYGILYED